MSIFALHPVYWWNIFPSFHDSDYHHDQIYNHGYKDILKTTFGQVIKQNNFIAKK